MADPVAELLESDALRSAAAELRPAPNPDAGESDSKDAQQIVLRPIAPLELGLLGATAVLCAYILMVGAGLRIALRADSGFDTLLATGLTSLLGIQAFIIIGGVTRVLPLTGVTLPFVSYGGSSLVLNYVLLALLLRISDNSVREPTAAAPATTSAGATLR